MLSRQGQILVAGPRLADPNFAKTLTLLVEHGEGGALGLVLNRPMQTTVAAALAQSDAGGTVCRYTGLLHQGGPCPGPLMVLHNREDAGGTEVAPGLRFSVDADEVGWLLEHHDGPMKCFTGYAGWGEGQLEAEIDVGSWFIAAARSEAVFEARDAAAWIRLLRLISPGDAAIAQNPRLRPSDPSLN